MKKIPKRPANKPPSKMKLREKRIAGGTHLPTMPRRSEANSSSKIKPFPIVGIGASAGGLEAFTDLLQALPVDTGMAFILIQHLDPTHESLAPEILGRITRMPVHEIKDGVSVEPNEIYIIPPNYDLAILHGVLSLLPRRGGTRGQQTGIDSFFQSLAEDQKGRAIGVILSGTASDGTQGIEAIKSEGGLAVAQDPKSAKYKGMPESAIASGAVDLILPPKKIALELARIAKHPYIAASCEATTLTDATSEDHAGNKEGVESKANESLRKIFGLLRKHTRVDFSNYKHTTIKRRIQRRMMVRRSENVEEYAKHLEDNPSEIKTLFNDLLIHVTEFLRDPDSFQALTDHVFLSLVKNRTTESPIRIWVPGCSTGEEVYSLAIVLLELLDNEGIKLPIQIFATDISEQAIRKARAGVYSAGIERVVNKERIERFFEKVEGGYKINKVIRDICLFSKHDITIDPPFSKLDLISCRNVLIYFAAILQRRVLPTFHYALNPGCFLWLGRSEGPAGFSKLFAVIDKTHKIFSKINIPTPMTLRLPHSTPVLEIPSVAPVQAKGGSDFHRDAERVALARYSPPSVVINADLEILKFQGRTVPYLESASGLPSNALLKMARPELLHELRATIQSSIEKNASVRKDGLFVEVEGKRRLVSIEVVPANPLSPPKQRNYVVFFEEASAFTPRKTGKTTEGQHGLKKAQSRGGRSEQGRQITRLEADLLAEKQSRQLMMEEFEATQEELTSANEELQSTNEELQSSNEELETAKEELQSSNEELNTVNDELQNRNADLTVLSSDLNNVLSNVEIPVVIVGIDRRIRKFTPKAEEIFNLISGDVGRPLSNIKPNFEMDLDKMVAKVIESLTPQESEIQIRKDGWMRLQVRPYRTIDNRIDGAVITLVDITLLKESLTESQTALKYATAVANTLRLPLVVLDEHLRLMSANEGFAKVFEIIPHKDIGLDLMGVLGGKGWNIPHLRELLAKVISTNQELIDFEVEHDFPVMGHRIMLLNARQIRWMDPTQKALLLSIDDVTERRSLERVLEQSEERFRMLFESAQDAILIADSQGKIEAVNKQLLAWFGYAPGELDGKAVETLIPDHFRDSHVSDRNQYITDAKSRPMGQGRELLAKRKDGSEFLVDISLSPVKTGATTKVTAIIRDISERKAVEKERTQILENERKANQVKDDFLAILSHELRTPLTTILGWAQELHSAKDVPPSVEQGLSIIEQSAKVQGQLIDDLLDISRIHSGKLSIDVRVIDLVKVLDLAVTSVRTLAERKSISVEVDFTPSTCMILADATRIQQVFWNLLTNAIKFTPSGGKIFVKLDLVESPYDRSVQVRVSDTGMGIKAEFLPHVFERFSQEDHSMTRRYGGLGLGLGLVKSLVEMQDGSVTAESPGEGKGATFTIRLPLVPTETIPLLNGPAINERQDITARLNGVRVLVVDDDICNRELFDMMLKSGGAEVKLAQSAAEARQILTEFEADVLVSDISMPGEDGYSFIRKIRELDAEHGGKIPAIALTAYTTADDVRRVTLAGFSVHVSKPVEKERLFQAIAKLVTKPGVRKE